MILCFLIVVLIILIVTVVVRVTKATAVHSAGNERREGLVKV